MGGGRSGSFKVRAGVTTSLVTDSENERLRYRLDGTVASANLFSRTTFHFTLNSRYDTINSVTLHLPEFLPATVSSVCWGIP